MSRKKRNDILDDILIDSSTDSDDESPPRPAVAEVPVKATSPAPDSAVASPSPPARSAMAFAIDSSSDSDAELPAAPKATSESMPQESTAASSPAARKSMTLVESSDDSSSDATDASPEKELEKSGAASSSPQAGKLAAESDGDDPSPPQDRRTGQMFVDSSDDDEHSTASNHTASIAQPGGQSLDEQEGPTVNSRGFSTTAAAPTGAADTMHMSAWSESDDASSLSDGSPTLKLDAGQEEKRDPVASSQPAAASENQAHQSPQRSTAFSASASTSNAVSPASPPRPEPAPTVVVKKVQVVETRKEVKIAPVRVTATSAGTSPSPLSRPKAHSCSNSTRVEAKATPRARVVKPSNGSSAPHVTYGKNSTIYDRAMRAEQRKKKWVSHELDRRDHEGEDDCTFKPQITNFANGLGRSRPLWRNGHDAAKERLYRAQRSETEVDDTFSFQPDIGEGSRKIVHRMRAQSARAAIPVEERLHFDMERRSAENSLQQSSRTLDESSQTIGSFHRSETDVLNTIDRLHHWKDARRERIDQIVASRVPRPRVPSVDAVVHRLTTYTDAEMHPVDVLMHSPRLRDATTVISNSAKSRRLSRWYECLEVGDAVPIRPPNNLRERTAVSIVQVLRNHTEADVVAVDSGSFSAILSSYEKQFGPPTLVPC